jgi:predicted glycosyltransferase
MKFHNFTGSVTTSSHAHHFGVIVSEENECEVGITCNDMLVVHNFMKICQLSGKLLTRTQKSKRGRVVIIEID